MNKTISEKIKELQKPLDIGDIEFRLQSISKSGYATILAYKDARVDMNRLDNIIGGENWKREHTRDNKNCIVSIYDDEKKEWISKEDTGTESNTEEEKGLASDSFKRACFNWGIGRELYDKPYKGIIVQLYKEEYQLYKTGKKFQDGTEEEKVKHTYSFQLKSWTWYLENNVLSAIDQNGIERFRSDKRIYISNQDNDKKKENTKWYNDVEKNIDEWYDLICDGKTTPEKIISKIEAQGFKISAKNKEQIMNLQTKK